MIGSYYSRRSTSLGVASIAFILLISVALLYHQKVTGIAQPIFEYDKQRYDSQQKEAYETASPDPDFPDTESIDSESSPGDEIWAKPSEPTTEELSSTTTSSSTMPSPSSFSELEQMCDREGVLKHKTWKFDPARDSANYGLDNEQCESAFPDLFQEIYRAKQWRQENRGNITEADLDLGWRPFGVLRAMIYERQVS